MSYSLICKCYSCKKKSNCIDSTFVQAAISGIHSANYANGIIDRQLHRGAGDITINCINYGNECPQPEPSTCVECPQQTSDCKAQPVEPASPVCNSESPLYQAEVKCTPPTLECESVEPATCDQCKSDTCTSQNK